VEQAAIAGVLESENMSDPVAAEQICSDLARRLDVLSEETEQGWEGERLEDGGVKVSREVRGVREVHILDPSFLVSSDARKLCQKSDFLKQMFQQPATLKRRDENQNIFGPTELLDLVIEAGRKGISLQRYKGLGEMNPEQLWETTLDLSTRTLLQVQIGVLDETDEIFSKLMGDVVEPRREFIQENALEVANLDI